jgi:hypothetical protein
VHPKPATGEHAAGSEDREGGLSTVEGPIRDALANLLLPGTRRRLSLPLLTGR